MSDKTPPVDVYTVLAESHAFSAEQKAVLVLVLLAAGVKIQTPAPEPESETK